MIKAFLRFFLLLALCCMLVFAPEIFSSVSAPYSPALPERVLLRIMLCCDAETSTLLNKTINAYQKEYSFVHLRVTQLSDQQLRGISSPYPDVILCPQSLAARLPADFTAASQFSLTDQTLLCAVLSDPLASDAAAEFADYIDEAFCAEDRQP